MGLAGRVCAAGELDLVGLLSSGGSMLIGAKLGCCGSVMSQYPMPRWLTMGMASLALVHRCVVLVSGCLNSPNHWLLMNSMGSKSPLGCYDRTSSTYTDTSDCIVFLSNVPSPKPVYDTIWEVFSCTIRSRGFLAYDMISRLSRVRYQSRSHCYYNTWY